VNRKKVMMAGLFVLGIFVLSLVVFWGGVEQGSGGWLWLDRFAIILGIAAFVPIVFAAWEYVAYISREEKALERIRREPGESPAVLLVEANEDGGSSRNQVQKFLGRQAGFKTMDFDRDLHVVLHEGSLTDADLDGLIRRVREEYQKIAEMGADRIHLFLRVPVVMGAMVGEVLANRIPVVVYHYDRTMGYQNWGLLHR